jgi:hypothetical protein
VTVDDLTKLSLAARSFDHLKHMVEVLTKQAARDAEEADARLKDDMGWSQD